MILAGWPGDTLIILGTLFGIDMVFYGAGWAAFGLETAPLTWNRMARRLPSSAERLID